MKKDRFDDDGRTVADMSGIGRNSSSFHREAKKNDERKAEPMSRGQMRQTVFSALLSGGLIALVFIAAAALIIALLYFLG